MSFAFNPLSKPTLQQQIDDFVNLSKRNIDDEYWSREHFLTDLPRKWELSFYVTGGADQTVGFLIASEKKDSVHVHKFVVDKPFQKKGLGRSMLNYLKGKTDKPLTLKVHKENLNAIGFYERNGFTTDGMERDMCLMKTL